MTDPKMPEPPHTHPNHNPNPLQQQHSQLEKPVNIDNVTLGEIKQIAALFGQTVQPRSGIAHPLIGKHCIARCYAAGVHAGTVEAVDGENVILRDSRRLWAWKAADGVALSGVAQHGLKSGSKLDVLNPVLYLTGVCELIPTAPGVMEAINAYK